MLVADWWVFSSIVAEFGQLLTLGIAHQPRLALRRYFIEVWNLLDVMGLGLGALALALHTAVLMGATPAAALLGTPLCAQGLVDEDAAFQMEVRFVQRILSPAVWALMTRTCRLTYLHPVLGPMMRMLVLMAADVAVCIFFGGLLSLAAAAAIVVMFKRPPPLGQAHGSRATGLAGRLLLGTGVGVGGMDGGRDGDGGWDSGSRAKSRPSRASSTASPTVATAGACAGWATRSSR